MNPAYTSWPNLTSMWANLYLKTYINHTLEKKVASSADGSVQYSEPFLVDHSDHSILSAGRPPCYQSSKHVSRVTASAFLHAPPEADASCPVATDTRRHRVCRERHKPCQSPFLHPCSHSRLTVYIHSLSFITFSPIIHLLLVFACVCVCFFTVCGPFLTTNRC